MVLRLIWAQFCFHFPDGDVSGLTDNSVSVWKQPGIKTQPLDFLSASEATRDLRRPSSTQIRRHRRRSRNVRGSVRTPCPHLTSVLDKRAVVPLLWWLQCLQACRQVVRCKPTPRRIKTRSLSDAECEATLRRTAPTSQRKRALTVGCGW